MKTLYYGGQKSGKSLLAEQHTVALAGVKKPYYIATYDNSYKDVEMAKRIQTHRLQREERFFTIEETHFLSSAIKEGETYLIDCMSMWLFNTLAWNEKALFDELEMLQSKQANIVFVLNNVNSGVIPLEAMSRKYVDRSGIIGQQLAMLCDEVYEVKLGLKMRLK